MEGVKQRLTYWGFDEDGSTTIEVKPTVGGYEFRGDLFTDVSVPPKWNKLKAKLTNKQAVQDTIEEAAYTWFNRIMAIKILEKRGYIPPTLAYVADIRTPQLVQEAKRGQHELKQQKYVDLLQEYLLEDKEEQALGLLLSRLCNNNILLHDVFGRINDYTEILLPNNLLARNGIIDLINSDAIENEQYQEVELIGWLYQFYISDKKDEVFKGFKANKKARPEDIPAATQIFTPKWIVKYMVENTVGKIYLDYDKTSDLKSEMKYLVENDTVIPSGVEGQAESISLISSLEDLTLIDPAAGSGHILVTGFELLFKMYREQGYTAKNAVLSILQNNLFGLDIDDRAMQLSRFAVLLKAAENYSEILTANANNALVLPHIYSFPESHNFQLEELQSFLTAKGTAYVSELKTALLLLNEGKNIGAALKLELSLDAHEHITNQYQNWYHQQQAGTLDIMQAGLWQNLLPFIEVLLIMTKKYSAVVANPPYMGLNNLNETLIDYLEKYYYNSRHDLSNVFIKVCQDKCVRNGIVGMINQQSWMFAKSYIDLRKDVLDNLCFINFVHLGPHAFPEIKGEVVQSVSFTFKNQKNSNNKPLFIRLTEIDNSVDKELKFLNDPEIYNSLKQNEFENFEECKLQYGVYSPLVSLIKEKNFIKDSFDTREGLTTGDNERFLRYTFEISKFKIDTKWFLHIKGGAYRKWYGNIEYVVNWEKNGFEVRNNKTESGRVRSHNYNDDYVFNEGFTWGSFGKVTSFRFVPDGFVFDSSGSMGFSLPKESNHLKYTIGYLNTKITQSVLPYIKGNNNAKPGHISLIPFKGYSNNINILNIVDSNIFLSKKDWDSRETSWGFETAPLLNESASLKMAYQKWQDNVTQDFLQLHANEEELNRIFIDIYGLQEELSPEVALKDITILQDELDRNLLEKLESAFREQGSNAIELPIKKDEVISQFLSYCIGLFMGRYRLDKPGLHIAHPNPTEEELASYVIPSTVEGTSTKDVTFSIDEDAIIPLMSSECAFPDDALVRIKNLIHDLWGEDTLTENSNFINECLGTDLDKWLTDKFWGYHTSMYKKKPIYWLFSSNPKKPQLAAFKVLTYMHRMDKYTVSKIQRNYLHPHQEWIKKEIENMLSNEVNLSKIEVKRLEKLRSWDIECRDYNEVLKTMALQEITFDLDDGVTVNYEKFEGAVAKI
jgi:hypothetical protein